MGQMANAITVLTSFLLGRYIVEQEQQGSERAKYGAKIIDSLSAYLTEEYGRGFSRSNVAGMRQFYVAYKDREDEIIRSGIGRFGQTFGNLIRLVNEGAVPQKPQDILHTPYVLEFAGLEDKASYHENDLF